MTSPRKQPDFQVRAEDIDQLSLIPQRPSYRRSSSSISSGLLERVFSIRGKSSHSIGFDSKGALGLNVLYCPSEALIEYVFVHGLGGGSTKTWCLSEDPNLFWLKEWLPRDPAFRNVRIYSFGYNADWTDTKDTALNIQDFGQSLLEALRNSPHFRIPETNPIVCVGHSMGGLVIKQAYVLARQDPTCTQFAKRFKAMIFLATPHRGSDLAQVLNNVLRASAAHSSRAYISNLERSSEFLTMVNDAFRHYIQDLTIYSFYETQQTNLGVRSVMIVHRESAILGYPGERVALLNANHRGVCKFESPSDPNYITVRDAFQAINEAIMKKLSSLNAQKSWTEMQQIENYLGVSAKPEDDLRDLEEARITGSCEWFAEREAFQSWADSEATTSSNIYWVSAKPATGKSVLSGYIINTLNGLNLDCSYYFFRHGDKERSSLSGLLRSMAFQMALISATVRSKLLSMIDRGIRFNKDDAKTVWRKILLPAAIRASASQTQYWVVDALDECSDFANFFPMMASIESNMKIKIFITSRRMPEIAAQFSELQNSSNANLAICEEVSFEDTRNDIKLYLEANKRKLRVVNEKQRNEFLQRILEKSEGCFLWVRLVLEELAMAWTVQHVECVLEEVPQNMDPLYTRALSIMSSKPSRARDIARAILTWAVCSIRPLTIPELQSALKIDIGDEIQELEAAVASLCAQLVHVDKTGRVLMVHLTARTFLVDKGLESDFAVDEKQGHLRLAQVCLQYLGSDEMKPAHSGRSKKAPVRVPQRSPFASYAAPAFSEHMRHAVSKNELLASLLDNFLKANVLAWIEHIASSGNLFPVTGTANSVKYYLQRRIEHSSPLGEAVQLAESWAIDLHRIVVKFGNNLVACPSSIYWLIPPFCPASSAIASSFRTASRGIQVKGLLDTGWDDRLSCIDTHDKQVVSVACAESFFAVGLQVGQILLYHNTTCQEWKRLDHRNTLRHLRFDSTGTVLASAGRREIRVWDIESGFMVWHFMTVQDILTFTFADHDKVLMAATRANSASWWNLQNGRKVEECDWTESVYFDDEGQFRRPPLTAAFSPDESLIAVVYRGRPICLWDLDERSLYGVVGRERDPSAQALGTNTSPASLVFNTNKLIPLLAAAYEDGDLCLFNYEDLKLVKLLEANAQVVACSPDGSTLATGNSAGMVQLIEFDTLQLLYQVNAVDYGIRSLAFSSDNLRFLDVRGTQCNVWEPAVLSGLAKKDGSSTDGAIFEPRIIKLSDAELEITTINLEDSGDYFFVGKSDGTVCVYDTENGAQRKMLYQHTYQIPVTSMTWGSQRRIIVTADAASRFIVCILRADNETGWALASKVIDLHANSAILKVLLSPKNDMLLISTNQSDTVWNLSIKSETSCKQYASRAPFDWVNHPLNEEERILVTATGASVSDWESSSILIPEETLQIPSEYQPLASQGIKNVIQFSQDDMIAIELLKGHEQSSATQLLVFESSNFRRQAQALVPILELQAIDRDVMHLIGGYGPRLIFLNKTLWVCSVDVKKEDRESDTYIRHFPIPSDWRSQQRVLQTRVSGKGDILFVKGEQVAVIKRGLEFEEQVSINSG